MTIRILRPLRALASLLLTFAFPAMAQLPMVLGEPAQGPKAAQPAPQLRIEAKVEARPALRARAMLPPVTERELARLRGMNGPQATRGVAKRLAIGIVRDPENTPVLPSAADLAWIPVAGGYAAQMAITSPDAAALRISMELAGVPGDVQMVFFGSTDPGRLVGPVRVGDIADRTGPWWSPVTDGETQTVEIFVPGTTDPKALALRAVSVSHLFTGPASRFEKTTQDIGTAGSCNVDLPCSPLDGNGAFQNAANAVAQMLFNDGPSTFLCTGTLLADTDPSTQLPWFYSANHCFENEKPPYKTPSQMQSVASTLQTLWFFQSSACNSGTVSASYRQLFSGATYIYNNTARDVLFLRLNGTPPTGAWFAGWDASAIPAGTPVADAHHPNGDLKKVSQGSVLGFLSPDLPPVDAGATDFIGVRWSSGTTEGGSSGSPLLTQGAGSQYVLRGGLWGGSASCENRSGTDIFSRFDLAYPALAQYLSPANAPAADYTDLWWNPNESGWGLNIVQHPSRTLFAVWYTYAPDGSRTWFVMPSGSWTSPTTYTGPLYTAAGPAADGPFDPSLVTKTQVGTATLSFTDANDGTWSYTVNGVAGSQFITRQSY